MTAMTPAKYAAQMKAPDAVQGIEGRIVPPADRRNKSMTTVTHRRPGITPVKYVQALGGAA